jgi:hypothetical protein
MVGRAQLQQHSRIWLQLVLVLWVYTEERLVLRSLMSWLPLVPLQERAVDVIVDSLRHRQRSSRGCDLGGRVAELALILIYLTNTDEIVLQGDVARPTANQSATTRGLLQISR